MRRLKDGDRDLEFRGLIRHAISMSACNSYSPLETSVIEHYLIDASISSLCLMSNACAPRRASTAHAVYPLPEG